MQKFKPGTYILILIFIVAALFGQTIFFGFTNWDDPAYITQNELIRHINSNFFSAVFTQPMHGHYHPLTWLSLAVDFQFFHLEAWGYHLHNLLLHIVNTILAFYFIRKISQNDKIAFFTALLFAIHPYVNESVSWITERKNLLFTSYFLVSILIYLRYLLSANSKFYWLCMISFLLSLLSKGSAMVFPLILLALLYLKNQFTKKEILKTLPFWAIAGFFAFMATLAQKPLLEQADVKLPFDASMAYSGWSFAMYLFKAFFPSDLAAFHPIYADSFPAYFYFGIILILAFLFIVYQSFKKNNRTLFFGLAFFFINIVLFLKLSDTYASSYFMAERYTYVAYIGLFYVLVAWIYPLTEKYPVVKIIAFVWIAFLGFSSFNYAKTWKNSVTLWENVLKTYPESHVALLNYGNALRQEKRYTEAIQAYNKIKNSDDIYYKMLENRAFVYYQTNQYSLALSDYTELLKKNPSRKEIKQTISNVFLKTGNISLAYSQLMYLLKEDSTMCDAWNSLGNYFSAVNKADSALWAYSKAIQYQKKPLYFYNRGTLYSQTDKLNEALADFNVAISLDSLQADFFINQAITYFKQKDYVSSLKSFDKAIRLNPQNDDYYMNRCNVNLKLNLISDAISDLNQAIELKPNNGDYLAKRAYLYQMSGNKQKACEDVKKAVMLGYKQYESMISQVCK